MMKMNNFHILMGQIKNRLDKKLISAVHQTGIKMSNSEIDDNV